LIRQCQEGSKEEIDDYDKVKRERRGKLKKRPHY
jgi:hypothetical protein